MRPAGLADVETVGELIDDATRWVGELGFEQWPLPFPRKEIEAAVERGEVYLGDVDGEPVATVTLLWDDPEYWGKRPPDAAYVHRLAVRRDHAGRGLGAAVVEWANGEAVAAGRGFVRLDCLRDSRGIRDYYERLGFEHQGDFDDRRRGLQLSLYERPVRP